MTTKIFNLIILDASGSMNRIKEEAIDNVNETIQTIREAQRKHSEQQHFVTIVTFNDTVKTICDCVSVDEVKEFDDETYQPNCFTALYDAMGFSLTALRSKVEEGDRVLVTVVTDGLENASREYTSSAIKALVDELKEKGWVFAYLGANHDVEAVASSISITNVMEFKATPSGTRDMTRTMNRSRNMLYCMMSSVDFCAKSANENFFENDDDDDEY